MKTLRSEPYTMDGQTFMLKQMQWLGMKFWTFEDEGGIIPELGRRANRHATREAAIAQMKADPSVSVDEMVNTVLGTLGKITGNHSKPSEFEVKFVREMILQRLSPW